MKPNPDIKNDPTLVQSSSSSSISSNQASDAPKTDDTHKFALKTIIFLTQIVIKQVLVSLYGFEVGKVNTLNMDGKKKKRGGLLIAKAHYMKA